MKTSREEILERVRDAMGGSTPNREADYAAVPRNYIRQGSLDVEARLELLVDRLNDYGATVFHAGDGDIAATCGGCAESARENIVTDSARFAESLAAGRVSVLS